MRNGKMYPAIPFAVIGQCTIRCMNIRAFQQVRTRVVQLEIPTESLEICERAANNHASPSSWRTLVNETYPQCCRSESNMRVALDRL